MCKQGERGPNAEHGNNKSVDMPGYMGQLVLPSNLVMGRIVRWVDSIERNGNDRGFRQMSAAMDSPGNTILEIDAQNEFCLAE
jgi:hypothetical protein